MKIWARFAFWPGFSSPSSPAKRQYEPNDFVFTFVARKNGTGNRKYYFDGIGTKATRFELTNPLSPSSCRLVLDEDTYRLDFD